MLVDMFHAVADKIWYQRASAPHRKRVAIVGGMHGDEPEGIALIHALLDRDEDYWADALFDVTLALGNPEAIASSRRVDTAQRDLNRAFGASQASEGVANPRVHVLQEALNDADIVLDIHQTHLPIDPCAVCPKTDAHLLLASHLGARQAVTGTEKIFGAQMLSDWANQQGRLGLTFETGQAGTQAALEVAQKAVQQLLFSPLEKIDTRPSILLWEVVEGLPAPGENYRFVRPFINGSRVQQGEPIAVSKEKTTKALMDGAIFLPRSGQETGATCCIQVKATDWP